MRRLAALPLLLCLASLPARADFPVIDAAQAVRDGSFWRVEVTLRHPDTGWDHFADGWEVLDQEGSGVGFRELVHPHVDEQPFTRALVLTLPEGTTGLYIRARCSRDGLDYTHAFKVALPE